MKRARGYAGAVAVVTGAASGIGLELVRQLQRSGANPIGLDLRQASAPTPWEFIRVDVTDHGALSQVATDVCERHGRLDLWINNAGIGVGGETQDVPFDACRRVVEVNVLGVLAGVQAAYPHMLRQGHGQIVNVASIAGLLPLPGQLSYVASKHAVVGLSRALRIEAEPRGVGVTTVCPGRIDTAIYDPSALYGYELSEVMKLWPRAATAESCARQILESAARNEDLVVITRFAWAAALAYRRSPRLVTRLLAHYWQRVRRTRRPIARPGRT